MSGTFDSTALRRLVGNDDALIARLLAQCKAQVSEVGAALRCAASVGDTAEVARLAHHLKGTVSVVGADRLVARLCEVEAAVALAGTLDSDALDDCAAMAAALVDGIGAYLSDASEPA